MKDVIKKINSVLEKDLLIKELTHIPRKGANDADLNQLDPDIQSYLNEEFRKFLSVYNGINLDVIKIYGVGNTDINIKNIKDNQNGCPNGYIVIGDDPAGYLYLTDRKGIIYSYDVREDSTDYMAQGIYNFINKTVFGEDAKVFGGNEWENELRKAGIII